MTDREDVASLIYRLAEAADEGWGSHYPCLRDDLGDLHNDLLSAKESQALSAIVEVAINFRSATHTAG